jgi:hypothetical protein
MISLNFALFITFLTLFLKLLGLQEKVPKTSAGSWFHSWMVLFTKEYFPMSVFCFLILHIHLLCVCLCIHKAALWSTAVLEKLTVPQLLITLLAFYETSWFIAVFTSDRNRSLSWVRSIQSTPYHHIISLWFVLISLFHSHHVIFIFKVFRPKFCMQFLSIQCVLQIPPISFSWTWSPYLVKKMNYEALQ